MVGCAFILFRVILLLKDFLYLLYIREVFAPMLLTLCGKATRTLRYKNKMLNIYLFT